MDPSDLPPSSDLSPFVADLAASMSSLRPILPVRRGPVDPGHIPLALSTASHVFLRVDAVKRPLTPPYDGPFLVIERGQKTFTILKNNKNTVVSVDRVKPAFVTSTTDPEPVGRVRESTVPRSASSALDTPARSHSGRILRPPDRLLL